MKVYQKLFLGVIISSLLLGILGAVSFSINNKIQQDNQYIIDNSLTDLLNAKKMSQSILAIEETLQDNLLTQFEFNKQQLNPPQLSETKATITNNLEKFQSSFLAIKKETIPLSEEQKFFLEHQIDKQFTQYKSSITRYLLLVNSNPQFAYIFFKQKIENSSHNKLLPLLQQYQELAVDELASKTFAINSSIKHDDLFIALFTLLSLLLSFAIGTSTSYQISQKIQQLTCCAAELSQGKLEAINFSSQNNEIELQILADSFNQIIADIKNSTVSRTYLDNILASMLDSLIVIKLDGTIEKVNLATLNLLGYSQEDLLGKNINLILKVQSRQLAFIPNSHEFIGNYQALYLTKFSQTIPVNFSSSYLIDRDSQVVGIVCVAKDITAQYLAEQALRQSQAELHHAAFHDRLTGLPNRAYFNLELNRLIKDLQLNRSPDFAVLFIDLDRFKIINDSLGHEAGDLLLIQVAARLQSCLRESDFVARLGGDEFVILLSPIHDLQDTIVIAERLKTTLSQPINLKGTEVCISASIGIAISDLRYDNVNDFLRDADTAMYEAKAKGKNGYTVFEPAMYHKAQQRLQLEKDLRRALTTQQFELFYQPIVHLTDRQTIGFEALLRWHHPHKGLIHPHEFIPVAEETGLILPLGWWVLQTACQHLSRWHQEYPCFDSLSISVNISPLQFSSSDFISQVTQILKTTQLDPQYLQLEITESTLIKNLHRGQFILKQLRQLGIKIALDDFGTGYSSLNYLSQLPINTLKIDRSFLHDLSHNSQKLEILKTIIYLGQNLNIDVIAEGIEFDYQKVLLSNYKCQYGQGFLFSQPLPSQSIELAFNQV